jgi:hypothetical protein
MSEGGNEHSPDFESEDRRTQMLVSFFRFLAGLGIAYFVALACFVLEFTIGIKTFARKLFRGHYLLDISRYIAYIVPM